MYLIKVIKKWYKGKFIEGKPSHTSEEDGKAILHLYTNYYEQPLLAKILKYIGQAWFSHWKVLLPTAIAIIFGVSTILLTLFIYLDSKSTRETQKKENNSKTSNHQYNK
jgi:hypothetical protein